MGKRDKDMSKAISEQEDASDFERFAATLLGEALDHYTAAPGGNGHHPAECELCLLVLNVSTATRIQIRPLKAEMDREDAAIECGVIG